jgi:hypothetical protein
LVVVSVALLAAPAGFLTSVQASTLEEASEHFVSYQFDGGSHHDAPDGCADAQPEWAAVVGAPTDGLLVAPDDVSDVFLVDVPSTLRGKRLHVELSEVQDAGLLDLTAFVPGCAGSVLDLVNWPTPEPSPPQPAAGQTQHAGAVSAPVHCDSDHWVFYLDQLQGTTEPASIHVAWTDGSQAPVDLAGRYGNYALYATEQNLGITLKGAWANLANAWGGDFGLWLGPCDAVDGGAVYGMPPVAGMGFLDFTPTRAGPHVVQVTFNGLAGALLHPIAAPVSVDVDSYLPVSGDDLPADPTGTLHGFGHDHGSADHSTAAPAPSRSGLPLATTGVAVPDPLLQPIMMPATCHWCAGDLEGVWDRFSYRIAIVSA